jgi:hypothetical protein
MTIRQTQARTAVTPAPTAPRSAAAPAAKADSASHPLGSDGVGLLASTSAASMPATAFAYAGVTLPNLGGPRRALSGAQANMLITATYHNLDQAFSAYLGDPPIANWLTFGKYASHEAGLQIADLENVLGTIAFQPPAIKRMVEGFDNVDRVVQSIKLFCAEVRQYCKRLFSSSADGPVRFQGVIPDLLDLHNALVAGNKGVYSHIAPAFDLFMKTEAAGQDGAAALARAGFGSGQKDPQGFVLQAFRLYKSARELRARMDTPGLSMYERLQLSQDRSRLVARANLLMVVNEQWNIVQSPKIFGDPDIARLTRSMEGSMTIVDAQGEHQLLPNGGNWTDFTTRMGFQEVPAGSDPEAISIVDQAGKRHDYVPKQYADREGTIYTYFDNLGEERSRKLIETVPPPLPGIQAPKAA